MWILTFDNGQTTGSIEKPTERDVVEHIEMLDNREQTFVNLEDATGQLAVSGGKDDMVMVHCTPDFESGFLLAEPGTPWNERTVEMVIQGQRAEFSARYFVPRAVAAKVALYFLQHHLCHPEFTWENDQEAQLGA